MCIRDSVDGVAWLDRLDGLTEEASAEPLDGVRTISGEAPNSTPAAIAVQEHSQGVIMECYDNIVHGSDYQDAQGFPRFFLPAAADIYEALQTRRRADTADTVSEPAEPPARVRTSGGEAAPAPPVVAAPPAKAPPAPTVADQSRRNAPAPSTPERPVKAGCPIPDDWYPLSELEAETLDCKLSREWCKLGFQAVCRKTSAIVNKGKAKAWARLFPLDVTCPREAWALAKRRFMVWAVREANECADRMRGAERTRGGRQRRFDFEMLQTTDVGPDARFTMHQVALVFCDVFEASDTPAFWGPLADDPAACDALDEAISTSPETMKMLGVLAAESCYIGPRRGQHFRVAQRKPRSSGRGQAMGGGAHDLPRGQLKFVPQNYRSLHLPVDHEALLP